MEIPKAERLHLHERVIDYGRHVLRAMGVIKPIRGVPPDYELYVAGGIRALEDLKQPPRN